MSKIPSLDPTKLYYAAMFTAAMAVVVSGILLVNNLIQLGQAPATIKPGSVTPQEQTLTKVLDLLDNKLSVTPGSEN